MDAASNLNGAVVLMAMAVVGGVVAGLREYNVLHGGRLFLAALALGLVVGVSYRWAITPVPVQTGALSGLAGALMASGFWSGAKSLVQPRPEDAAAQRSTDDRAGTGRAQR
jgi:hypothetical protein